MTKVDFYKHAGTWDIDRKGLKHNVIDLFSQQIGKLENVNFYLMDGSSEKEYGVGGEKSLYIFTNSIPGEKLAEEAVELKVNDKIFATTLNKPKLSQSYIQISNEEGVVLGYQTVNRNNEFHIPYDVEGLGDGAVEIILYILNQYKINYLNEIVNANSWKKSKQKDVLIARVTNHLKEGNERLIRGKKEAYREAQSEIDTYKRKLTERLGTFQRLGIELAEVEKREVIGLTPMLQGLDMIAEHEKVTNLIIEGDYVIIDVADVHAFAMVDGKEREYYIGNMTIKINIVNSDVRFSGDNPRRSHWSRKDPHPHVDGDSGRACLGSASATISELASQREIYPLFLTCLDFLQNANTEDTAGKNIVNWDEVKPSVVEVKKPTRKKKEVEVQQVSAEPLEFVQPTATPTQPTVDPNIFYCEFYECDYAGEQIRVGTVFGGGEILDYQTWSREAVESNATWNGDFDTYVTYEVAREIAEEEE